MNEVKRQLDKKMGDTTARSKQLMNKIEHNKKQAPKKRTSKLYYVTFATFVALLAVLLYISPFETNAPVTSTLNEQQKNEDASLLAKAENFETHFYEGDGYTLYLHDGTLSIFGFFVGVDRKSIIDDLVLAEYEASKGDFNPSFHKEYRNAMVKVSGKQYTITADGLTPLTFTVFMDHIIVDDKGIEYIRKSKDW